MYFHFRLPKTFFSTTNSACTFEMKLRGNRMRRLTQRHENARYFRGKYDIKNTMIETMHRFPYFSVNFRSVVEKKFVAIPRRNRATYQPPECCVLFDRPDHCVPNYGLFDQSWRYYTDRAHLPGVVMHKIRTIGQKRIKEDVFDNN